MAVINPDHLLDQADRLVVPPVAGPPRQADLRRAISAAYYAVFHFTLTQVGDEFVGRTKRNTPRYSLVYRHVDHRTLRALCSDVAKSTLPPRLAGVAPANGFGENVATFAAIVIELQEKRHRADYDPSIRFKTSDALLAVKAARTAIRRFERASSDRRKTFLTLLICSPR